jgi:rSAM/selenodomain-associated transferase 2
MNAGAEQAQGDVYWFVHSDSIVPADADRLIEQALSEHKHWGRFDVRLSGKHFAFRIIEWMMNMRSCITGITTGDQGIFMCKQAFDELYGYKPIALMEDIDLSKRLLIHFGKPACLHAKLVTSSRRWEQHGIIRTVLLMWSLRLAYFLGVSPETLARRYRGE